LGRTAAAIRPARKSAALLRRTWIPTFWVAVLGSAPIGKHEGWLLVRSRFPVSRRKVTGDISRLEALADLALHLDSASHGIDDIHELDSNPSPVVLTILAS
jgi:hypothetical protein